MKHLDIRLSGRVQGVNFRASAQRKAMELGVKGFVRNEPNGDVALGAEADPESLDHFVRWLRRGPPPARVDHLESAEGELENFESFTIEG